MKIMRIYKLKDYMSYLPMAMKHYIYNILNRLMKSMLLIFLCNRLKMNCNIQVIMHDDNNCFKLYG